MKNLDIDHNGKIIQTRAFRAHFSQTANNFTSIVNLATGDDYIKTAPRDTLMELYGLLDGEKRRLLPGVPQISGTEEELVLTYETFGGFPIEGTVCCTADGDRLTIQASIQNHSDIDIVEILMPHLGGIFLGDDYKDDAII